MGKKKNQMTQKQETPGLNPQDKEDTIAQILQNKDSNNKTIFTMSERVPVEQTQKLEELLRNGKEFNAEIEKRITSVILDVNSIKDDLRKQKAQNEYLTHSIEEYQDCLGVIDQDKLAYLLANDLNYWHQSHKQLVQDKETRMLQFKAMLDEQKRQIEQFWKINNPVQKQKLKGFKLKRLDQLPDNFSQKNGQDFCWPTKSDMESIFKGKEIKIQKLEIGVSLQKLLSSIQVTLSDGSKSPLFKSKDDPEKTINIDFPSDKRTEKLALRGIDATCGLRLFYGQSQELQEWVENLSCQWKEQKIPDGEQIIGVYGRIHPSYSYCIANFGFITISYN